LLKIGIHDERVTYEPICHLFKEHQKLFFMKISGHDRDPILWFDVSYWSFKLSYYTN